MEEDGFIDVSTLIGHLLVDRGPQAVKISRRM
jgi:hypothetical protein